MPQNASPVSETSETAAKHSHSGTHETSIRILETVFRYYLGSKKSISEIPSKEKHKNIADHDVEGEEEERDPEEGSNAEPSAKLLPKDEKIINKDLNGFGLVDLANIYSVSGITVPKRKIWIILLGNHSAGKSSFINWYLDYPVQKTSVAIETTSFTLITAGKKRETFGGPATVQLFPVLKVISEMKGVIPSLTTEIVPSDSRNFDLITFIDSPGLVDGGVLYPFDPEKVLLKLADEADLIFSFFDPIGQALCARTMNVVESVCETQGHKIFFYLSKADTIPDESDRQKVLIQIAQSLTHRIKDRQFSLDIPPIYIPRPDNKGVPVRNHLQSVISTIDATIAQGVQKSLGSLKRDCFRIAEAIKYKLKADDAARKFNSRDIGRGFILLALATTPFAILFGVIAYRILNALAEANGAEVLGIGGEILTKLLKGLDELVSEFTWKSIGYVFIASISSFLLWWLFVKKRSTLSATERGEMQAHLNVVDDLLPRRHEELYTQYFEAHVSK